MKSLFTMGFVPSGDMFSAGTMAPRMVPIVAVGMPRALGSGAWIGEVLDSSGRAKTLAAISAGTQKMAEVRRWIASKIDQDPMLRNTLKEQGIVDNFWSYDDLVVDSQWYVDQTAAQLASEDPDAWDVSEDNLARTDDWVRAIDILHAAMREYGGAAGRKPDGAPGALTVPPRASTAAKSSVMQTVLLVAGAVGVVGLVALLAKA